jgi:hypothetical protein
MALLCTLLHHLVANNWEVAVVPRAQKHRSWGAPWVWVLSHATTVSIHGVRLEFSLEERVRMTRRPVTPAERRSGDLRFSFRSEVEEYRATGDLVFMVHGIEGTGARQKWLDGGKRLERQVPEIIRGIASACLTRQQADEAAREAALLRAEEARRLAAEDERRRAAAARAAEHRKQTEALVALADRHDQAARIRRLIAAARERRGDVEQWARWAEGLADELDPLMDPRTFEAPLPDESKP